LRLLLARHGEIDQSGRYFGATNLPISQIGEQQAKDLAQKIVPLRPDICLCSPMRRTRETCRIVSKSMSCNTLYIDDLREINFGLWEQLTFNEIADGYPEQTEKWAANPLDFTFPQGDNTKTFFKRITDFARQLPHRPEETILLITHGGVIRALICHFLGLDFDKGLLFNVKPAGLVTIEVFEKLGVLSGFNL